MVSKVETTGNNHLLLLLLGAFYPYYAKTFPSRHSHRSPMTFAVKAIDRAAVRDFWNGATRPTTYNTYLERAIFLYSFDTTRRSSLSRRSVHQPKAYLNTSYAARGLNENPKPDGNGDEVFGAASSAEKKRIRGIKSHPIASRGSFQVHHSVSLVLRTRGCLFPGLGLEPEQRDLDAAGRGASRLRNVHHPTDLVLGATSAWLADLEAVVTPLAAAGDPARHEKLHAAQLVERAEARRSELRAAEQGCFHAGRHIYAGMEPCGVDRGRNFPSAEGS